jgi:hypothetical protein
MRRIREEAKKNKCININGKPRNSTHAPSSFMLAWEVPENKKCGFSFNPKPVMRLEIDGKTFVPFCELLWFEWFKSHDLDLTLQCFPIIIIDFLKSISVSYRMVSM